MRECLGRSNKTFNFIRGTMTGHIYLILWGFLPLLKLEFCLGDTFGGKVYTFGGKVYKRSRKRGIPGQFNMKEKST